MAQVSFAATDEDRAVRRSVGMITLAVQEYSEGIVDGRIVDEAELAVADAILAQMTREAPSDELDAVTALVRERVPVQAVRDAVAVWFETHAIGVEPERPTEAPSIASGGRLFGRYCTSCHGDAGDGAGVLAARVEGPPPADFTDVDFMGGETQEEFFQAITLGVPGSAMPAWGDILGERDRWDLVAFLWTRRDSPSSERLGQLEESNALAVCAGCHGDAGDAPNLTVPGAMAAVSDAELDRRVARSTYHGGQLGLAGVEAIELVAVARRLAMVGQRPGDDRRNVDPRHVGLALRLVVEEYFDAVVDGEIVNEVEYGEARLFHARLATDVERLTSDGTLPESLGVDALVEQLGQAVLMRESPETVQARADAIAQVVLPALGIEPEDRMGEALARVAATIDRAQQLAASRPQAAADLLLDAYMQFEPIERSVGAREPGLITTVERRFSNLRGELGAGRTDAAGFEALRASLHEVEAVSAGPDTWLAAFIASLLIIVREGLEVILIISALAAYLTKGGHLEARRWLYGGAAVGIVVSVVTAFLLDRLLDNVAVGQEVLEGVTMLVAAVVLFSVSYWLISKVEARHWQEYIQRSLNHALGRRSNLAMAGVSFLAVYREGFETVLFYRALAADAAATPLVVGFAVGSLVFAVLWVAIARFSVRIPLKPFFGFTGGLLYLLAFRFLGAGIGELQEAGVLSITPVGWWPDLSLLAMSANLETGVMQMMLVIAAAIAAAAILSGRGRQAATSG